MTTRLELTNRMQRTDNLLAVDVRLRDLAARQDGVVTRAQLALIGITQAMVRAQVAACRWRAIGRHVVVLGNSPLTEIQKHWVGVLLLQKPCGLAGLTSAQVAGLTGFDTDRTHVVVQHATHTALPHWVKVHESRRFDPSELIVMGGGPPRTSNARSLVDAAAWTSSPRRACAILCAGVQQRLTTPERLTHQLRIAKAVRHARIMREIVGDISGGGHTLAEIEFGPLAARAGLPPPRRQMVRPEADGKIRYLDLEFDLPDGTQLAVEIDGAVHLQPLTAWDDLDRQNEIVIGGRPMLRFASLTVRLDGDRVVDQLVRMRDNHRAELVRPRTRPGAA